MSRAAKVDDRESESDACNEAAERRERDGR